MRLSLLSGGASLIAEVSSKLELTENVRIVKIRAMIPAPAALLMFP
jgi:hypothetical protein